MTKKLVVRVDGRCLTGPISGIGRVLSQTISLFPEDSTSVVISHSRPIHADFLHLLDYEHITADPIKAMFGQTFYHTIGEDVFWGPAHRLAFKMPQSLPKVVTIHDLVWKVVPATMKLKTYLAERLLFKRSVSLADKIICVPSSTAHDLSQHFPHCAEKISIIYPGVSSSNQLSTKSSKPFMLFVGTLEPRKNLFRLMQAYKMLPIQIRNQYDLVIAGGNGWGRQDIKKFTINLNLKDNVRLVLSPNDNELHQLYSKCFCLIMPSIYEGFGLPIAEAMQYGKPCLTSNISSMPEVAGSSGLFFDPTDPKTIMSAMQTLITNKKIYNELSRNAFNESSRFKWDVTAAQTYQVFRNLCG